MPCDFCKALAVVDFELTHMGVTERIVICGQCAGFGEDPIEAVSFWRMIDVLHRRHDERVNAAEQRPA